MMNDEFVGFHSSLLDSPWGEMEQFVIPIPQRFQGKNVRVEISSISENSTKKEDSPEVAVFELHKVSIVRAGQLGAPSFDIASTLQFAKLPPWAPTGRVDFRNKGTEALFAPYVDEAFPVERRVSIESSEEGVLLRMPEEMDTQIVVMPHFPLEEDHVLALELTARAKGVFRRNMVPFAYLFDEKGQVIFQKQFSQMPIDRDDADWVDRRIMLVGVKGARHAMIGYYINVPEGAATKEDASFVIRQLRFLQRSGSTN
jgi:hypothetical protein